MKDAEFSRKGAGSAEGQEITNGGKICANRTQIPVAAATQGSLGRIGARLPRNDRIGEDSPTAEAVSSVNTPHRGQREGGIGLWRVALRLP
jgi:hypothetical protein